MENLNGRRKKLLYLALCDPDLKVTGATVRMGAFVRHLGRYYDVTLVNMAGSGHRVAPSIEERARDHDNRLGISRRVRIEFSRGGYFMFSPALYRAAGTMPLIVGIGEEWRDRALLREVDAPVVVRNSTIDQTRLVGNIPSAYVTEAEGADGWIEAILGHCSAGGA